MNAYLFDTLTFAAVGVPAVLFALWKGWLALVMVRGTRVRTGIGTWLIRLYSIVAVLTFIIGTAYLLTVSDRYALIETDFLRTRQIMRLMIGTLYLTAIVASYNLWRDVQELERANAIRDAERDAARDAERDIERDVERDLERDRARDIQRDIHAEVKGDTGGAAS
jgi:hypothetical protein